MPRNGSGTYNRSDGTRTGSNVFAQEESAGIDILSVNLDLEAQDMADALTASIAKDGQTTPTANLPMGNFKHTGCAAPTADTDYVTRGYADDWYSPGLNWVTGLGISSAADTDHDITVATGRIMDSTEAYMLKLTAAFTKRIDSTFAVGASTVGGLSNQDSSGVVQANTWYRVFIISKTGDPTDCDIIFSTTEANALADTVAAAAGFTLARRIGWVLTDSSSNILAFKVGNDRRYTWDLVVQDVFVTMTTSAALVTMSVPPSQTGVMGASMGDSNTNYVLISEVAQTDTTPSISLKTLTTTTNNQIPSLEITRTVDSSSQIRLRGTSATGAFRMTTVFWVDDIGVA